MINLIIISLLSFLGWKICWYIAYRISISFDWYTHYAKMSWKTVKKLYPINPDKWTYNKSQYKKHCRLTEKSPKEMNNLRYNGIPIMLSFYGYQKLRYYVRKYGTSNNVAVLNNILEDVQEDIDKQKEQAQKEIDTALQEMRGAMK